MSEYIVIEAVEPYKIIDFDEGIIKLLGFTVNDFLTKELSLSDLMDESDYQKICEAIDLELNISNRINLKLSLIGKDDNLLTFLCDGQALLTVDKKTVIQCSLTDITNLANAATESKKAKSDLENFANSVPSGVSKHLLDNNLSVIWANKSFYDLCGYSAAEFKKCFGRNTFRIIYNQDLASVIATLADLSLEHDSYSDFRIKCQDESIKWVHAIFAHSGETSDGFPVINIVLTDITSLKSAEMRADLEKQKYEILSDITEEIAFEYDIRENLLTFAERFTKFFTCNTIISNPVTELIKSGFVPPESYHSIRQLFDAAESGQDSYQTELLLNSRNGQRWYMSTFSSIKDENQNPVRVIGLLRDIDKEITERKKLLKKAETDLMTGLLNKQTTEGRIRDYIRDFNNNIKSALILVDIDDFKNVNDTYGHLAGDEVIKTIADAFRSVVTKDNISGRTGGDEFTIFLNDYTDSEYPVHIAKSISNYVKDFFEQKNGNFIPTLSIGIVNVTEGISYSQLIEAADTALYNTKIKGKDGYSIYNNNMLREKYTNNRDTQLITSDDASDSERNIDFINDLINLLYMRQNTYITLEKVISRIGSNYNITTITIWEYVPSSSQHVSLMHIWSKNDSQAMKKDCSKVSSYVFEEIAKMSTNGSFYVSDTNSSGFPGLSAIPCFNEISGFVQSNIIYKGQTIGYICFAHGAEFHWSEKELSQFSIIFKMMSETICNKYMSDILTTFHEDMIQAYNVTEYGIIILNAETFDVIYYNSVAAEHFPVLSCNGKCHYLLMHEHIPCMSCPLKRLNDKVKTSRFENTLCGSSNIYNVSLAQITWSSNTKAVIISFTAKNN